jgi:hypothetical protein
VAVVVVVMVPVMRTVLAETGSGGVRGGNHRSTQQGDGQYGQGSQRELVCHPSSFHLVIQRPTGGRRIV